MKSDHRESLFYLLIPTIVLFLLTRCTGSAPTATSSLTLSPSPTQDHNSLSPDETATLSSLEKLDDYPFYVMHYAGEYEYPQISSTWPGGIDFACSLFATLGEAGDMLYGRNFDWSLSPALLLFTDPTDGYASVSMVDLEFLGIRPVDYQNLSHLPLAERVALLSAPSMPFDGMNEYGLTIGMTDVPGDYQDHGTYDPSKPTIGSIGIIRQVLDHARDVGEAIAIFEQYNIDFRGGPLIHYLLADRNGKAVLIEFFQQEMILLPSEEAWHVATNHLRCVAQGDGGCIRYRTISKRLAEVDGQLDAEAAMQLLSDVSQEMTQWSVVYDMTNGDMQVAIGGDYEIIYSFELDLLNP